MKSASSTPREEPVQYIWQPFIIQEFDISRLGDTGETETQGKRTSFSLEDLILVCKELQTPRCLSPISLVSGYRNREDGHQHKRYGNLHPQLTVRFIKNFLMIAKMKNIQLIITTHESHLLDLDVLGQDEIFFVEKNISGASILFPFDKFKERFDKKIEKAYLDGRYGGVPLFDIFFMPGESKEPLEKGE